MEKKKNSSEMFSFGLFQHKKLMSKNKHWMSEYLRFSCKNHTIFWFLVIKNNNLWMKHEKFHEFQIAMSYGPVPNFDLQSFFTVTFWAQFVRRMNWYCLFSQNREAGRFDVCRHINIAQLFWVKTFLLARVLIDVDVVSDWESVFAEWATDPSVVYEQKN